MTRIRTRQSNIQLEGTVGEKGWTLRGAMKALLVVEGVCVLALCTVYLTMVGVALTKAYGMKSSTDPNEPEFEETASGHRDYMSIFYHKPDEYDKLYGYFPDALKRKTRDEAKEMFEFAYDNYMKYAFPLDELNPIDCVGRGPDIHNPSNININDVLGNYSLTLVDTLDTLAVMRNTSEFKKAVQLVIDTVSFDTDSTVQVFEANIRILGALLSAHLLIVDPSQPFGDLRPPNYTKELLDLAHDLATRLLPAFENSTIGLPYPRVNLKYGLPKQELCEWCATQTCTAGAGSLLLEFGLLSKLVNDPVFESVARRAAKSLWLRREKTTGLLGNVIDVETGEWTNKMSGIGAGSDSFFEYLMKSYILFGEHDDYRMFNESYTMVKKYMRRGREHCNEGSGNHPVYVNVNMLDGSTSTLWIDSLQAAFAGVQVLSGDIEEAICLHALYYAIWKRFGALPERFNWQRLSPDVSFYPLRPELVESTYLLYQATKNPFYLHVGRDILNNLNEHTRVRCGYATIHNVQDKTLEDRMESFFLSETCKYLFLLFDVDNPLNTNPARFLFTTEGHVLPVDFSFREKFWENADLVSDEKLSKSSGRTRKRLNLDLNDELDLVVEGMLSRPSIVIDKKLSSNRTYSSCERVNQKRSYQMPIKGHYFSQLTQAINTDEI